MALGKGQNVQTLVWGLPAHTQVFNVPKSHDSFKGVDFTTASNWPGIFVYFYFPFLLLSKGGVEKLGVIYNLPLLSEGKRALIPFIHLGQT